MLYKRNITIPIYQNQTAGKSFTMDKSVLHLISKDKGLKDGVPGCTQLIIHKYQRRTVHYYRHQCLYFDKIVVFACKRNNTTEVLKYFC